MLSSTLPHPDGQNEPMLGRYLRLALALNATSAFVFWLALSLPQFLPWMKFFAFGVALLSGCWVVLAAWREARAYCVRQRVADDRLAAELQTVRVTAEKAKSDFLAVMSHELRTPMNSIVGFADLLASGELSHEQRECVNAITAGSGQLLGLIDHILEYSKIESGQVEFVREPVALRSCIEDVLDTVRLAAAPGVDLVCEIGPDVPPVVCADPYRLDQVLLNLVGNAVKFTEQGEVAVEVRLAAPPSAEGPLQLEFRVRDTGIGLPDYIVARLFKPFAQADSSSTRRYGGLGLGLAIARRLVELMGGKIGAVAREQRGSEFFFTLPVTPVEIRAEETAPKAQSLFEEAGSSSSLTQFAFRRTASVYQN
jgi:signal transduction histidine kinase